MHTEEQTKDIAIKFAEWYRGETMQDPIMAYTAIYIYTLINRNPYKEDYYDYFITNIYPTLK